MPEDNREILGENHGNQGMENLVAIMQQQVQQQGQLLQHLLTQRDEGGEVTVDAGQAAFMKNKLPQFKGEYDPEGVELWLQEMRKSLEQYVVEMIER